jgi:signal transduction histidine kinase
MIRTALFAVIAGLILLLGNPASAQQLGTAAEAKAMLEKAIAALKADKTKALADFSNPSSGFRDRDLYVFCADPDGKFSAHINPSLRGTDIKTLVDKSGKRLGEEIVKAAVEGKVAEVEYMFPRPGQTEPAQKVSFVTKVGDQVCGVGYYKP